MPRQENDRTSLARVSSEVNADVNATELAGILTDPETSLAVRFRHGDIDMGKGGGVLANVPADTDIGKVRDACLAKGWKLVITEQAEWQVYARIVHSSVSEQDLDSVQDCNIFRRIEHGLDALNAMDAIGKLNFHPRSFSLGRVDVSQGPHFGTIEDSETYVQRQFEHGFRGFVGIQASIPDGRGGASCPFVAAIKVTDAGVEIVRDHEQLREALPGYQPGDDSLSKASMGNRSTSG